MLNHQLIWIASKVLSIESRMSLMYFNFAAYFNSSSIGASPEFAEISRIANPLRPTGHHMKYTWSHVARDEKTLEIVGSTWGEMGFKAMLCEEG